MGRPHYGVNPGWGVTYTEPHTKLEFDSAIGVTFNAKNPATDYKDGDDFIWDWAVGKKLQDMSANGTKQTCSMRRRNVRFWGQSGHGRSAAYQTRL
jgi:hypothetical protein